MFLLPKCKIHIKQFNVSKFLPTEINNSLEVCIHREKSICLHIVEFSFYFCPTSRGIRVLFLFSHSLNMLTYSCCLNKVVALNHILLLRNHMCCDNVCR